MPCHHVGRLYPICLSWSYNFLTDSLYSFAFFSSLISLFLFIFRFYLFPLSLFLICFVPFNYPSYLFNLFQQEAVLLIRSQKRGFTSLIVKNLMHLEAVRRTYDLDGIQNCNFKSCCVRLRHGSSN
jgi:hypothetical protein